MFNRIIVDQGGRIVDYRPIQPFGYLGKLASDPNIKLNGQSGSKQVPFGVLEVKKENALLKTSLAGLLVAYRLTLASSELVGSNGDVHGCFHLMAEEES
jgi:hypothetical protein